MTRATNKTCMPTHCSTFRPRDREDFDNRFVIGALYSAASASAHVRDQPGTEAEVEGKHPLYVAL